MPSVNNASSVRDWINTCPALKPGRALTVDNSNGEPEYSVFSVPSEIKFRRNVLGEEILEDEQSIDYVFASVESFGNGQQNADNLGFFQDVTNWIIEQNAMRQFPPIDEGVIESIRPTLTGYMATRGASTARYQISIKITYRRQ